MTEPKTFLIEDALKAQQALRAAAGMGTEHFPVGAFVGMISDEIEVLRNNGKSDDQIADLIRQSSSIDVTGQELADHYSTPEERHAHEH